MSCGAWGALTCYLKFRLLIVIQATIWDDLLYLPEDIRILRKEPFRLDIFSFFFSRFEESE
jgi:hypothetical protein